MHLTIILTTAQITFVRLGRKSVSNEEYEFIDPSGPESTCINCAMIKYVETIYGSLTALVKANIFEDI